MANEHKCNACGKLCATKRALQQHRASKHSVAVKVAQAKPSAGKSKGKSRSHNTGVPVSLGLRVEQSATDSAVASGTDRVFHADDISTFKSGSALCEIAITAGSFSRLSVLSRAYQRVEFRHLKFRVTTYCPTSVGGGYVAAFVADPDDRTPVIEPLNWLTSQQGSVTQKWWQNAEIVAKPARSWYYTSPGLEVREYSPGRFVVVVDVATTEKLGLTVWATWTVKLSKATLEGENNSSRVVMRDLYTQSGHKGLFYKDATGAFKSDIVNQVTDAQVGESYRLSIPINVMLGADATSASLRTVWWLRTTTTNDLLFCLEKPDTATDGQSASEQLCLRQGAVLELELAAKSSVSGEQQGPSGLISAGASQKNGEMQCSKCCTFKRSCSERYSDSSLNDCPISQQSQELRDKSLFMERLFSMESQLEWIQSHLMGHLMLSARSRRPSDQSSTQGFEVVGEREPPPGTVELRPT
nr:MAG: RNA-dependent RNA polymerase [Riboviria sp.]